MRIRAIDNFRGLAIVLMIFFTMISRLSDSLPDLLDHNAANSTHVGDFVLPMFLFASGMSLVFFAEKRKGRGIMNFFLDTAERIGKMFFIWLFIAPFATGELFGMEVVMLNLLLFIPSLALAALPEAVIAITGITIAVAYLLLNGSGALPDFTTHYLGGYAAAPFYLPVMLGGVMMGKRLLKTVNKNPEREIAELFIASLALSLVFLLLVPPYKMDASPSFMALSIMVSLAVFHFCTKTENRPFEYLGKRPLDAWLLLFILFLVPMGFYEFFSGKTVEFDWVGAMALSIFCIMPIYAIMKIKDWIVQSVKKERKVPLK